MADTALTFPTEPTHPLLRALERRETDHQVALSRQAVEVPADTFEPIGAAANRVLAQLQARRSREAA